MTDDWTERLRELVEDVRYIHEDLLCLRDDPESTPAEQGDLADAAGDARILRSALEDILRRREGK